MGSGFNLGKIFGIEIRLHYSWFIIFMLVTVTLVSPNWSQPLSWVIGIITSLLFFASVLAHELAHSLVGRANGVTIKSITLFIFGGMAQMTREATKASAELKMAAAGPACSLVIGGIFGLLWFFIPNMAEPMASMCLWLFIVNVALAVFNLIPGFPLDGGRVFRSLMWRFSGNYQRSTLIATRVGQGVAYTFILGGILIIFWQPFGDLSWINGLWLAFIGWFLQNAAATSYRQVQWRETLHGLTASQVMTSDYQEVPSDITVAELVKRYVLPTGQRFFLLVDEGRVKGILTIRNVKSVPQSSWDITQVEKIMLPIDRLRAARPEQDVLSIVEEMNENDINQMPVISEGRVIGLITRDNLIRFMRTRSELGGKGYFPFRR